MSAAYDVLGDEEKRKQYDQVREMAASGGGFRAGGFPDGPGGRVTSGRAVRRRRVRRTSATSSAGLGRRRRTAAAAAARPARGADLETEVRISFDDAMTGSPCRCGSQGPAPCDTCHGSRRRAGHEPDDLPAVRRRGHGQPSTRAPSDVAAVPQLRRVGARRRARRARPVGSGSRAPDARVPGEDPRRCPGRCADQARRPRRARAAGAPAGDLYVRVHVARRTASSAAAAPT